MLARGRSKLLERQVLVLKVHTPDEEGQSDGPGAPRKGEVEERGRSHGASVAGFAGLRQKVLGC